jgi:hypothetical protein
VPGKDSNGDLLDGKRYFEEKNLDKMLAPK